LTYLPHTIAVKVVFTIIASFIFTALLAGPCDSALSVVIVASDTQLCKGDYLNLDAQVKGGLGPFSYHWGQSQNNRQLGTGPIYKDSSFIVTVTDEGCGHSATCETSIEVVDLKSEFSIAEEQYLYVGKPVRFLNASNGASLVRLTTLSSNEEENSRFMKSQPDYDIVFPESDIYEVILEVYNAPQGAEDGLSCRDYDTVKVYILDSPTLYIPNAFAPDGMGPNRVFTAVGNDISEYHMQIFGRFGEMIFSCDDISCAWDGRDQHGLLMLPRTYLYRIAVVQAGQEREYQGYVHLMR